MAPSLWVPFGRLQSDRAVLGCFARCICNIFMGFCQKWEVKLMSVTAFVSHDHDRPF